VASLQGAALLVAYTATKCTVTQRMQGASTHMLLLRSEAPVTEAPGTLPHRAPPCSIRRASLAAADAAVADATCEAAVAGAVIVPLRTPAGLTCSKLSQVVEHTGMQQQQPLGVHGASQRLHTSLSGISSGLAYLRSKADVNAGTPNREFIAAQQLTTQVHPASYHHIP
jgi:hypothetical protein